MKKFVLALIVNGIAVFSAQAQDKAKYCKNAQTARDYYRRGKLSLPIPDS